MTIWEYTVMSAIANHACVVAVCNGSHLCDCMHVTHVQYSDIIRFRVRHNRHNKVSRFFMCNKTVTKLLIRIRVRKHKQSAIKDLIKYWTTLLHVG